MSSNIFVVRLKNNGRFFTRHYRANNGKQAAQSANGKGKILSVRKLHPDEIIGTIKSMNLQNIIGVSSERVRRENVVQEETTLSGIVFPRKAQGKGAKVLSRKQKEHYWKQRKAKNKKEV